MQTNHQWFTEKCEEGGSAFSMQLHARLHREHTAFQTIEIYETDYFGKAMVIDGFVMLTEKDHFIYHEMMVHPALFWHVSPARVAVVGGGDCGVLREVLKHPEIRHCYQVEIDERVTRLAERYFPDLCEANDDPRAEFLFVDGARWMSNRDAGGLDVVIADSTDPVGPGKILFTEEFYRDCHRTLATGGIFVQQSESPLFHMDLIEGMRTTLAAAGFGGITTIHFPQPTYPSGWWTATLACKDSSLEEFRKPGAGAQGIDTRYYNSGIHEACTAAPEFFRERLD